MFIASLIATYNLKILQRKSLQSLTFENQDCVVIYFI